MMATAMSVPEKEKEIIHIAAHLHDIGKIGIPDKVLNKTGSLTFEEKEQIQAHPRIGHNILKRLPMFREISCIVLHHHERFDGFGYPEGLKGESIPLASRIISLADTIDAITADRPYRKAKSTEDCFGEIELHTGSQFCPTVISNMAKIRNDIEVVLNKLKIREIKHYAFVGHEELMHSRRLI
ncbi:MAG: HD domain-containing protein [Candidatus Kuenenia sp.]|nr:HD domain-containing protein [Candidatus Kuenenia hertensis]